MFLHSFSFAGQESASKNVLKLLKPQPGSTIIGTQAGSVQPCTYKIQPPLCEPGEDRTVYQHSKESIKILFENAAKAVGLDVIVWADYDEEEARSRSRVAGQKGDDGEGKRQQSVFGGANARYVFFRVEIVRVNPGSGSMAET
ncbi:putative S-adenosyl-L-methionine-dependent methyltransferase [Rosellinia necatrix]|uniref:Putative S-adenosyl-L-methionine-dependent methyltransferase n=1 Tax=Rosellinia necatrix TaxID=77044 RepID=A0A1W2THA7_ROSNE|nr:putative S-adenosyl-L-methionine-dependent methyltransferase [Rosellinia necatrix]